VSNRIPAVTLAVALLALDADATLAQGYPFSQRARVDQTVAFTDISVVYGRPVARGRRLFGDSALVKWDTLWHPGADSATRVSFTHDVKLEVRTSRPASTRYGSFPARPSRGP
jgi:hypothetical protein